ncbi:putative cytokinetic ring protein SteA [Demequina lignilytica]|uniref:Cytokinetic ring protein SteA n=1 Tax=Demequina lignilytica TaxID=3051663 RepID=A0AB35ML24_9MICO|nr:putative cytokinetic ring protein SteA [Demequina sp. SYSU T0a273]MDN4484395.1 putative cytokinetic ring protein SteA [Demequina sp. SYSU T0a273]
MTPLPTVSGTARVDSSPLALARRLRQGDVAIIDALDLDRRAAQALLARQPAAVVNAQASLSGRLPHTGSLVLLDAGIPVVDAVGEEVLAFHEGDRVTIEGGRVTAGDTALEGNRLTSEAAHELRAAAAADLPVHVGAFAANTLEVLARESALLLDGTGLPELRLPVAGRAVVVVAPGFAGDPVLSRFARERRPLVIGIGEGADAARAAGLAPRIVLGDIDTVAEDTLARANQVIIHDPRGHDAGRARAQAIGLTHDTSDAGIASEDLAILAAQAAGATVIVVAGGRTGLLDHVEDRTGDAAGALLARLAASGTVVDADVLGPLYRHRYSAVAAWGPLVLATVALVLAAWGTPEGHDAMTGAWEWLSGLLEGAR